LRGNGDAQACRGNHRYEYFKAFKVKKVQRRFAVEYKSGRRKSGPKANSIWGDMDLKSVAQDVQEETQFLPADPQDVKSSSKMSLPGEEQAKSLLTLTIRQQTNAPTLQEIIMTDENNTMNSSATPAIVAPDAPKKERKPRARKAALQTASVEAAVEPTAGKQKRGRKPKSTEAVSNAKRAPVKRTPRAVKAATAAPTAAIDEMAGLLQLEKENQRLRKLLAEKLRAENGDLRKRLNLD